MNDTAYPSLPYSIRLNTRTATVWITWQQNTPWDTPAPVTYSSDYAPAIATVKNYLTVATGFQGYPIENVDAPAPMDIHAALISNRDNIIEGFDLIGTVPDPPSSPDEDIEPADDEEDSQESEPAETETAVYESIINRMKS